MFLELIILLILVPSIHEMRLLKNFLTFRPFELVGKVENEK